MRAGGVTVKSFMEAAHDYCDARESDRVLRLGMRPCEHAPDWPESDAVQPCYKGKWHQDSDGDQVWDEGEFCEACAANRKIIEQSRVIRSRFGGLAAAMMAAFRRVTK